MKVWTNAILVWGGLGLIIFITLKLAFNGQSTEAALFFFVTFFVGVFWITRKSSN